MWRNDLSRFVTYTKKLFRHTKKLWRNDLYFCDETTNVTKQPVASPDSVIAPQDKEPSALYPYLDTRSLIALYFV